MPWVLIAGLAAAYLATRLVRPRLRTLDLSGGLQVYAAALTLATGGIVLLLGLSGISDLYHGDAPRVVRGVLLLLGAACVSWFTWLGGTAFLRMRQPEAGSGE